MIGLAAQLELKRDARDTAFDGDEFSSDAPDRCRAQGGIERAGDAERGRARQERVRALGESDRDGTAEREEFACPHGIDVPTVADRYGLSRQETAEAEIGFESRQELLARLVAVVEAAVLRARLDPAKENTGRRERRIAVESDRPRSDSADRPTHVHVHRGFVQDAPEQRGARADDLADLVGELQGRATTDLDLVLTALLFTTGSRDELLCHE